LATRVIIVRHGESTYNVARRVQGHIDDQSLLTAQGEAMALQVGAALQPLKFDAIYASPFQRAQKTAELLISQLDQAPALQTQPELREVSLPWWEGLTFDQVEADFPEAYGHWRKAPHLLKMSQPTGDREVDFFPIAALYHQAQTFWQSVLPKHAGQTLLLVAHSGINRALINTAIGLGPDAYQRINQSNCCISVLNFAEGFGGPVQIESANLTAHLGQTMPAPKTKQTARFLLVRHGETQWNREGRFQGQIDIPLNDNGRHQASQARDFLKTIPIDAAISSDLARPQETAEIILQNHPGIALALRPDLREIGHGTWEGKLEAEIRATDGPLLDAWQSAPATVQMPEGENLQDVFTRAVAAWQDIVAAAIPGTTTLVVAHDAINKALLCHIVGLGPTAFWSFKQGNGAVSVIDYPEGPDSPPILQAMNITTHLGGVLDKTAAGAL
jgi:phosphoserine phosphatase